MQKLTINDIRGKIYRPLPNSHKGQNGKLLIIGGSHLFHAASLWALKVASKIVDMVFYSSVPENNELVMKMKEEFRDGIVVPREEIDSYINEADVVLIGPGLERSCETKELSESLFKKYPNKKWVVDAGTIQVMLPEWIPNNTVLTPHAHEFETLKLKIKKTRLGVATPALQDEKFKMKIKNLKIEEQVRAFAKEYHCIVLLKGKEDIISNGEETVLVEGGNAGMTKGGTGDVLAGLLAALACKNDLFLATLVASCVNKKAGDNLYKKVGYYFNASDLVNEIPGVLKELM